VRSSARAERDRWGWARLPNRSLADRRV